MSFTSKCFVFHDHHCGLEVSGDMLAIWREAGDLQWRDVMLAFPTYQYNRYNQFMFTRPGALGVVLGKGRGLRNAYLRGKRMEVEVLLGGCGCFQVDTGFLDPSAGPNLPDIHGTEIQGCWGVPNPMKIPKRWQATTSEPFNCDWDRNNWRMGWSQPKKSYCCTLARGRMMVFFGHVWSLGFGACR